jgi:hypothetical protein
MHRTIVTFAGQMEWTDGLGNARAAKALASQGQACSAWAGVFSCSQCRDTCVRCDGSALLHNWVWPLDGGGAGSPEAGAAK